MKEGIIFDIKQMALFDGPGLRQTVFLKGCPLHCSWCQNPEGMSPHPELMVSWASCIHCHACEQACLHPEKCIVCGQCIPVCPLNLRHITGERITSEALVSRILKDCAYYERYGGGVTFSGGEPLLQGAFLLEVMGMIPQIHRAMETSGYCERALFKEVVDRLDFVIMDIKMMDAAKHQQYCGVDNKKILANAEYLFGSGKPFIIRIPVIPGVNDSNANFRDTAAFLRGVKNLQQVELLHYNQAAGAKYSMVGKQYLPDFDLNKKANMDQKAFWDAGIRSTTL